MTFDGGRSKPEKARRRRFLPQAILSFFGILTISSVLACTPPVPSSAAIDATATQSPATRPVVLTETSGSTPIVEAPSASSLPPPATSTSKAPALGSSLVFVTDADARVRQSRPSANYGTGETLRVDGGKDSLYESFIRFTITGVSGTIQGARLRLYVTDNGTQNGPAVYATSNSWSEAEITWDNRPAPTSEAADNKESLGTNNWAEFDVTPLIGGEGIFSFVLVGDSSDGVHFSSRQGAQPPQLVLTLGDTTKSTPTVTPTGSQENAILVGAGDISQCDNDNDELTAQLLDAIPGTVFTTGDNAYDSGTYTEHLNCYQPTWGRHKERTKPVPGNHEYRTAGAAGYFQYFNNMPSYYAYKLGSWRVYALNSEIDMSASSAQIVWLQADLAANPSQCVLAYWHQPRWSSGSQHGSDENYQALWQILYEAGAELVMNGHEHLYERFAEMDATGAPVSPGLREIIVGTGGGSLYEFDTPLPSSEVRNSSTFGVLKLTLHADRYDWEFIPVAGKSFTDKGTTRCH
jgi:acid phosphatase type 7